MELQAEKASVEMVIHIKRACNGVTEGPINIKMTDFQEVRAPVVHEATGSMQAQQAGMTNQ